MADFDQDGDLDLATGVGARDGEARTVAWWENPGGVGNTWKQHRVGETVSFADRIEAADLDGDGAPDVVVAEEGQRARVHWFRCPKNPSDDEWVRQTVVVQATTNNLDLADMDDDGDIDIVCAEHRGEKKVQIWENLGRAAEWKEHVVSRGKESHLGAQVADMDGDGDPEILSIAWDNYADLHLWRNDQ